MQRVSGWIVNSAAATCIVAVCAVAHAGDEWPRFRGPDGQGHAGAARLPARWGESENVRWKTAVAGRAWSSPVISDGVCWLTTAVVRQSPAKANATGPSDKTTEKAAAAGNAVEAVSLRLVAIELETGATRHDIELFERSSPETIHALNSYASPTPVLQGGRVYCHFGNMGTACVDTESARIVWTARIASQHGVGPGSSPVLYDNLLIIPSDGMDAQFVVALDVATGRQVWKTNRPRMTGDNGDFHKAFCTPLVVDAPVAEGGDSQPQVVAVGPQWVVAYNPRDGSEIWKVHYGEGFSNAPCPVYAKGIVYICTGFMTPELWAIRTDGRGDVTDSHVVWQIKKQVPTMSSPILVGDVLYMIAEQGVVTCVDAATGQIRFQKRIPGSYSSSPLVADGKLIFSSREGEMTVVAADAEWQPLAVNRLQGELLASPAVWRDSWIIRTNSNLYRIGESPP